MNLEQFNALDPADAAARLQQACAATKWVEQMVEARPFSDRQQLQQAAIDIWKRMARPDVLEALDGHPQIGDPDSLKQKYRNTHVMASGEQSGVDEASDATIAALANANQTYLERFGFIFIICASGKSAGEMLDSLQARLPNSAETELATAAEEQGKITAIRLDKLLER